MKFNSKRILFILFFVSQLGFTQNQVEILQFTEAITALDFSSSKKHAAATQDPIKTKLELLHEIISDNGQSNLADLNEKFNDLNFDNNPKTDAYLYHLIQGYKYLNYEKNRQSSYIHFNEALNISRNFDQSGLRKFSLLSILSFYLKGALQGSQDYTVFLDQYKEVCSSSIDWLYYYSFKFNLLGQTEIYDEFESKIDELGDVIFEKYDSLIESGNDFGRVKYLYYKDKANHIIRKEPAKARALFLKASTYYDDSNFFKRKWLVHYSNLYRVEILDKNYTRALDYLNKAAHYNSYNDSLMNTYYLSIYKSGLYDKMGLKDSAYKYQKEVQDLGYLVNFQKENQRVAEVKVKLDVEKKEKEILKQTNLIITLSSLVVIVLILSIFYLSSSNKKRLLAIQERELEAQKNITLLKEQEIATINAMVEGQEKERKRVAEDLHDNLGSVIATLKLHFDNLRINQKEKKIDQETLFDRTEGLIDDAYKKVRSIAHAKNAGVIANQGLLVAVKLMAEKISSANTIQIDVIDYGLEKPIENGLEISLFRIIQELTTNIIKHAQASHATINITQDTDDITILIEDNGIGMDASQIDFKKGMGLHSINTRVQHLNGSFTIDSTPTKGSTIIINIPI